VWQGNGAFDRAAGVEVIGVAVFLERQPEQFVFGVANHVAHALIGHD
jgi:hypothetical protein